MRQSHVEEYTYFTATLRRHYFTAIEDHLATLLLSLLYTCMFSDLGHRFADHAILTFYPHKTAGYSLDLYAISVNTNLEYGMFTSN